VIPISFVSEHIEPREIRHRVSGSRDGSGIQNFRGPRPLDTYPTFIKGLPSLVESAFAGPRSTSDQACSSPQSSLYPRRSGSGAWKKHSASLDGAAGDAWLPRLFLLNLISWQGLCMPLGRLNGNNRSLDP